MDVDVVYVSTPKRLLNGRVDGWIELPKPELSRVMPVCPPINISWDGHACDFYSSLERPLVCPGECVVHTQALDQMRV